MSVLAYRPTNDEEIFKHCTKDCGIVTATEDFQYFTLGCKFCEEKFLYFDAFIGHMQTVHLESAHQGDSDNGDNCGIRTSIDINSERNGTNSFDETNPEEHDDLSDADPALLEPQMVIKQELQDDPADENLMIDESDILHFKPEQRSADIEMSLELDDNSFLDNTSDYDFSYLAHLAQENVNGSPPDDDDKANLFPSYDEMVEEALLGQDSELTMHIKDRKMIQFLIDSYKRNPFLWDHRHPQFRDRVKRQRFLEWIVQEFKRRFNITLARDAITRKWDNLRTVYKRECNRMALERTNISTLWYFKELHFLNSLYSYNHKMSEAVVQETSYRRRFSAIWNDVSTAKLLSMVKEHQCFYNRNDPDYRSKEKRGEALQQMANELQEIIDVSTIQISKRISQLRFDYSKQKLERLNCERQFKKFLPSYTYYEHMLFMDDDVSPFKCQECTEILQSWREMELHMLTHQPNTASGSYKCTICNIYFQNADEFNTHKHLHLPANTAAPSVISNTRYNCDLCTASFREKSNYEEHMRRHNDELLLPSLVMDQSLLNDLGASVSSVPTTPEAYLPHLNESKVSLTMLNIDSKPYICDVCHRSFASQGHLNAHRVVHSDERDRRHKCDYPHCGKSFLARQSLLEHVKMHYTDDDYKCNICGKGFKSSKNLQNHKQIHDKIKRYICQICGSAFAQAAGLYLHKRRHNRPPPTARSSL